MINTQYINLNMIPSGVMPVLYCSQYDIGRPLGVVVYNGSESVDLSSYTCTIEATRTDKTPVTAAVITSGNIGVFETTATMTNQADTYKGKLVLTDGNGKRVASLAFVLVVTVRTMDEDAEEIEEDASLYQQYTGTVQTIIASIRADLAAEASTRAAAVSAEAAARQSGDNTLQSNLNAEASTRASADALLQSQIDQLVAPSGEAPSAAEVENARIGADGVTYPTLGDAIRANDSLLKSQIDAIEEGIEAFTNLWDESSAVDGYYFANGAATASERNKYSAPISVKDGETYYFGDNGVSLNARFVDFMTAGGGEITTYENVSSITVPSSLNIAVMRVTFNTTLTKPQINKGSFGTYCPYGDIGLVNRVESLEDFADSMDDYPLIESSFDITKSVNLIDQSALIDGYYVNQANGNLGALATQSVTDYIPINDNLVFSANAKLENYGTVRYALYNQLKGFVSGGTLSLTSSADGRFYAQITVPSNAKYIRISASKANIWDANYKVQLEEGSTSTEYHPYGFQSVIIKDTSLPEGIRGMIPLKYKSLYEADDLSDGDYLVTDKRADLKKGESITFACDITTFSKLLIGWTASTPDNAKVNYAEITPTQIIVHGANNNGAYNASLTHGLTIQTNLQFRMTVLHDSFEVELMSDGERYTGTANCFKSASGYAFALSDGSTLTNCKLSWVCTDINKKIWMFGNSYFGLTNTARWMYYCQDDGYTDNALIDAYAGRNTSAAVVALDTLIALGKPDYIVWCMGMNDGSDTSASTPSDSWLSGVYQVLSICETYNIIPVFATIPNVPSILHTGKNAWVKASGYRYIDFAKAVGAESANSTWYTGMLATDNVHPTAKGAVALYGEVLADFPEIMIS